METDGVIDLSLSNVADVEIETLSLLGIEDFEILFLPEAEAMLDFSDVETVSCSSLLDIEAVEVLSFCEEAWDVFSSLLEVARKESGTVMVLSLTGSVVEWAGELDKLLDLSLSLFDVDGA